MSLSQIIAQSKRRRGLRALLEQAKGRRASPRPSDVLVDGSSFRSGGFAVGLASSDGRRMGTLLGTSEVDGARVFKPAGTPDMTPAAYRSTFIPAPDLTLGNVEKFGRQLLEKYLPQISFGAQVFLRKTRKEAWRNVTRGTVPVAERPLRLAPAAQAPAIPVQPVVDPEKLDALAASLDKDITKWSAPRTGGTYKRDVAATSAAARASGLRYLQVVLRAIAAAARGDTVPEPGRVPEGLSGLPKLSPEVGHLPSTLTHASTRKAVEWLLGRRGRMLSAENVGARRYDRFAHEGVAFDPPPTVIFIESVEDLIRYGKREGKGIVAARRVVESWLRSVRGRERASIPPQVVVEARKLRKGGLGWQLETPYMAYRLGLEQPHRFWQALADLGSVVEAYEASGAGAEAVRQRKRAALEQGRREAERKLTEFKVPGFVPTPPGTVLRMLEWALIRSGDRVLEPSAGKGDIADAISTAHPDARLHVIELNETLREILQQKGYDLVARDFLEYDPGSVYDKILMNPPFEKLADIDHVQHAFDLLRPGGRLVAIMSEGAFFRTDRKAQAFRDAFLDRYAVHVQKIPEGAFRQGIRPTDVRARLVVFDKPR